MNSQLPPIVTLYKKIGETPLGALERLRTTRSEFKDATLSYAGRLDPLAEGILLVLVNDECSKREQYLNLEKEYEMNVLFGAGTDTYDIMGIIQSSTTTCPDSKFIEKKIQSIVSEFIGSFLQPYPPYSSKTVNGKPLFSYARKGTIDTIHIPSKYVTIHSLEIISTDSISSHDLLMTIEQTISKVTGDFRQEKIIQAWQKILDGRVESFPILRLRISCSSGTYMRSLAYRMGQTIGLPALALSIKRTKIGSYTAKLDDL